MKLYAMVLSSYDQDSLQSFELAARQFSIPSSFNEPGGPGIILGLPYSRNAYPQNSVIILSRNRLVTDRVIRTKFYRLAATVSLAKSLHLRHNQAEN